MSWDSLPYDVDLYSAHVVPISSATFFFDLRRIRVETRADGLGLGSFHQRTCAI